MALAELARPLARSGRYVPPLDQPDPVRHFLQLFENLVESRVLAANRAARPSRFAYYVKPGGCPDGEWGATSGTPPASMIRPSRKDVEGFRERRGLLKVFLRQFHLQP